MSATIDAVTEQVIQAKKKIDLVREEMGKVIVGQTEFVDSLLMALLTQGHVLVEGVPGLAKTLAVSTLATTLRCDFKRIQFTPDLLPADLVGTMIFNPKEGTFSVKKGPVFTNMVLGDEINRAPAKVQSALLEVMQERQVTIGGETFATGNPFFVMATQNPIEQEGTYSLPESQTDRFMMKVLIGYPSKEEERRIVERMAAIKDPPRADPVMGAEDILEVSKVVDAIYVDEKITDYLLNVVFATREPAKYKVDIEGLLEHGASPRASLAFHRCAKARAFLQGRGYVTPHDIKKVGFLVLRHRIRLSYEAEAEGLTPDAIVERLFNTLQVP